MKLYKAQGLHSEDYGNFKPFTVNRQAILKGVSNPMKFGMNLKKVYVTQSITYDFKKMSAGMLKLNNLGKNIATASEIVLCE